jgi:hypothetical protein
VVKPPVVDVDVLSGAVDGGWVEVLVARGDVIDIGGSVAIGSDDPEHAEMTTKAATRHIRKQSVTTNGIITWIRVRNPPHPLEADDGPARVDPSEDQKQTVRRGTSKTQEPKPVSPKSRSRDEKRDTPAGAKVRQTYRTIT